LVTTALSVVNAMVCPMLPVWIHCDTDPCPVTARLTSALLFEYVDDAVASPVLAVRPVGVFEPVFVLVAEGVLALVLPLPLFEARSVADELTFTVGEVTATLALAGAGVLFEVDGDVLLVTEDVLELVVVGTLPPF
jgi:hypothetical protein